jgi:glycosyltransferase involved in cell wall biosynthesis
VPHSQKPLISVIIPTYNAATFLPAAIESIRAQSYEPIEILIIDDGSTDHTSELVRDWQDVRYFLQSNQGPSAARNAGIDAARGELLTFLDADDLWTSNHLLLLVPPLMADPSLRFAWGQSQVAQLEVDPDGNCKQEILHESVPQFLIGSGAYRPAAFEDVGRFDPTLQLAEDVDWILTARQKQIPHLQLTDTTLIYRKREGSLTSGKSFHDLNVMTAIRRSIHRHRGGKPTNEPRRKAA